MGFVIGFLRSKQGRDCIWVVIDRLTKPTYFLPICYTNSVGKLVKLFVKEIIRLYGGPKVIILDT